MPHGPKVFESLSLRERLQTLTGWEIWFHYFFLWNIVWYEDIPNNIILLYIYIILYYTIFHRLGFIIVHIGGFGPPILCFHKRHWVENSMSKIPWKNRWKIWFGPPKPGGCQINRQNAQWANRIFVYFFNIT